MKDLKTTKTHLNYVCPRCYNQIENCNCEHSPQQLLLIDYNIQEQVRILNQKGYKTKYSCESHTKTGNMYVSFWKDYHFSILPKNFYQDKISLSFVYPRETTNEEFEAIKEKQLKILLDWCNELLENKN